MRTIANKYFVQFIKRFKSFSNEELISAFNNEVGNLGWGTARASFLSAIHAEFDRRKFNYNEIGDKKSLSFKNQIILNGEKIYKY